MEIDWKKHLRYLNNNEIQEFADNFRNEYWKNEIPVDIEFILESKLGFFVTPVDGLRKTCGTDAMLLSNMKEIVYDPVSPSFRVRYTIAHEIGHYILHRSAIEKLRPESYDDWLKIIEVIPETIWGRAEYQAYEFAGRVLVPRENLLVEVKNLKSLTSRARNEIQDIEEEVLIEYISPKLSKSFEVSSDVIKRRLRIEEIRIN